MKLLIKVKPYVRSNEKAGGERNELVMPER